MISFPYQPMKYLPALWRLASNKFPAKFQTIFSKSYDQGMWYLQHFWQVTNSSGDYVYCLGTLGFSNSALSFLMSEVVVTFPLTNTLERKMYRHAGPNKNVQWNSIAVQLTGGFHKVNLPKCSHRYILKHICHNFSHTIFENNLDTLRELSCDNP